MWNLTDNIEQNCKDFLVKGGMDLFLQCKLRYGSKYSLIRSMLGPISNASEFKDLCQILKKKIYLMNELLTIIHETDDFENGYIATGIIAQIVFDDCGLWNIKEIDSISNNLQLSPLRPTDNALEEVLEKMINWPLNAKLTDIIYNTFRPIVRLLFAPTQPVCQYWAMWTLAHFAKKDGKCINIKYHSPV